MASFCLPTGLLTELLPTTRAPFYGAKEVKIGVWVLQGSFLRLGSSHNSPQGPPQRQAPTGMEFGAAKVDQAYWDSLAWNRAITGLPIRKCVQQLGQRGE